MARFDQGIEIIVGECRGIHAPSLVAEDSKAKTENKKFLKGPVSATKGVVSQPAAAGLRGFFGR